MSRLQDLHPDQQAVLQLVLRRRMPYSDLAGLLALSPEGVRERALDAIDGLAPDDVEGLALEDRDRIADHLLGQDAGAEHEATAALIAEHPPAAAWAATVAAELEPLGGPAIAPTPAAAASKPDLTKPAAPAVDPVLEPAPYRAPAGGPLVDGAPLAAAEGDAGPAPGAAKSAGPGRRNPLAGRSPLVLAASGVAAVVVVLLVLWIAGVFSGDDDSDSASTAASDTPPAATTTAASGPNTPPTAEERAAAAQFVAAMPKSIRFRAPASARGAFARVAGTATPAVSAANAAFPVLRLTIRGLPPLTAKRRYFAWADKNGADPIFLGQLTENTGAELPFQGLDLGSRQAAVVDPAVYSRVRVTLEGAAAPTKPGPTIIVGTITPRAS